MRPVGAGWRGAAAESQASWRRGGGLQQLAERFIFSPCMAWICSASAGVGGVFGSKASFGSTLVLSMQY